MKHYDTLPLKPNTNVKL